MAPKPKTVSTHDTWKVSGGVSANTGYFVREGEAKFAAKPVSKAKADAIYTYLRAVRALGKDRVTSSDVASALQLPEREVRKIMSDMTDKGVRAG